MTYKITTHDLRPPVQGGPPPHMVDPSDARKLVPWDGRTPFTLPVETVDESNAECGRGWNACVDLATAIRIAGEWPSGRPAKAWKLAPVEGHSVLARGDKLRSASWVIERPATVEEWHEARLQLYAPMAGDGLTVEEIVTEVEAWSAALGRPAHDEAAVEAGLREALTSRRLGWKLHRYHDARAAWDARTAWDAWAALAARTAWDAWAARDARAAWAARDARAAWDAWDARDAWAALAARTAWAALVFFVAAKRNWVKHPPHLLTAGLRDAYTNGLAVALSVEVGLGYAMKE